VFNTPASTIASLHAQGKKVICYFSSGTADDFDPDYGQFTAADKGNEQSDWPGQYYANIKNPDPTGQTFTNVWNITLARIQLAASKGCDAIDPDNTGKHMFAHIDNID
jgi:hypothetical protein